MRRLAAALAAVAALALAGCGGDDEHKGGTTTHADGKPPGRTQTATRERQPATAKGETTGTKGETTGSKTETAPESAPGGAGDEEAAHTEASLTGRGGRIAPPVVHVPAYIAVRVSLHSADGRDYGLRFPGRPVLRTGARATSVAVTITGLRPGRFAVGAPSGDAHNGVRIVADARPGP